MSEAKIHSALVAAFIASQVMPTERTAFEGKAYTPVQGQSWARLTGLPTGRAPAAQGRNAAQEWTGVLQIDLFHPKDTGHAAILADVDKALSFFKSGRRIGYQGQSVLIRRAERSQIRQDDIWQAVSVSVRCTAQAIATADDGPWVDPGMPAGVEQAISADPDNRLKRGADNKLYVHDDLTPDPLAYYILAKG